ncbi:HAL/PAL/TAL family ammonia-lyase [Halorarum salinum]|uniref:Histidine ammonia-lyase n=1 Tax=Halorarum salinum TaxID=2743089 RepID=A0A7D5LDR0_9EURY|nr:histidine ammonia-lyase [Halobaculum salinum]QLG64291.1 histidine ammonia-lyase [Halobaculum salinum]
MSETADGRPAEVVLDGESLTPEEVAAVARDGATVRIAESAREAVRASRDRVVAAAESGEAVYGLNTGFGHLVDARIDPEDVTELQTNLVRSHATGAGRLLATEEVRGMMLTRVNALVKGYSGVREVVVDHLVAMLNEGVHPVVPSRGSLGASGDLAPLAHVAVVLLGEGRATVDGRPDGGSWGVDAAGAGDRETAGVAGTNAGVDDGPSGGADEAVPGDEALAAADLDPLRLAPKEGLALINGTQLTLAVAALLVVDAERVLDAADAAGTLTTEVTMSTTANCDPAVTDVRPHAGQAESAANVRRYAAGSEVIESHRNCDRVQDAYSIRCLPQVHGAVRDAVGHLREAVEVELNGATDNPLVFPSDAVAGRASGGEDAAVLSAGNFHGAPLAHRLDYVAGALTDLAAICERRVDRMLNPEIQEEHLPPFLTERSGLRSGYMIAQYTAAALLNDCRAAGRHATDSTPVSGNQEDHVSMSGGAALTARTVLGNVATVVGVELVCGAQAAEFLDPDLSLGDGTAAAYDAVREVVPKLVEDRPLDADLRAGERLVSSGAVRDAVEAAVAGEGD